ncbi:MAG: ankyrin repeat domain-containing protein [Methylocystaceae bacterium]|nr:ankyrin repeat domain-containing protein [Methylocystaceae bacterium]
MHCEKAINNSPPNKLSYGQFISLCPAEIHSEFRKSVRNNLQELFEERSLKGVSWKKIAFQMKLFKLGEASLLQKRSHTQNLIAAQGNNSHFMALLFWLYIDYEELLIRYKGFVENKVDDNLLPSSPTTRLYKDEEEFRKKCNQRAANIFHELWGQSVEKQYAQFGPDGANWKPKKSSDSNSNILKPLPTFKEGSKADWLNPLRNETIPFVSRPEEKAKLDTFINCSEPFQICALAGPSGAGKTRLAAELMRELNGENWTTGFTVNNNSEPSRSWQNWTPNQDTLIVVDYTFSALNTINAIIDRCAILINDTLFSEKIRVRLLLIDHIFPEDMKKYYSHPVHKNSLIKEAAQHYQTDFFHKETPIQLFATEKLLKDILFVSSGNEIPPKFKEDNLASELTVVLESKDDFEEENLAREWEQLTSGCEIEQEINALLEYLLSMENSAHHPLFAAILGHELQENYSTFNLNQNRFSSNSKRRDLVVSYLQSINRLPWLNDTLDDKTGSWIGILISVATLTRGANINLLAQQINEDTVSRPIEQIIQQCQSIVSSNDPVILQHFSPDFMGEVFFLSFLNYSQKRKGISNYLIQTLSSVCHGPNGEIKLQFFRETINRIILNLIQSSINRRNQEGSAPLNPQDRLDWENLCDFLTPSNFPEDSPIKQSTSLVLSDMIAHAEFTEFYDLSENLLMQIDYQVLLDQGFTQTSIYSRYACIEFIKHMKNFGKSIYQLEQRLISYLGKNLVSRDIKHAILMNCADYDLFRTIKYLLAQKNINIGVIDRNKTNALIIAAGNGAHNSVRLLVKYLDVDYLDMSGRTALNAALIGSHNECAKILLENGADPNFAYKDNWYPLEEAANNGNLSLFNTLIQHNAKINLTFNRYGNSCITLAAYNGHVSLFDRLFELGASLDLPINTSNDTPLIAATRNGHLDCVKWLLDKKADPDLSNKKNGAFPLIVAIINNFDDIVLTLLNNKANPNQHVNINDKYGLISYTSEHNETDSYTAKIPLIAAIIEKNDIIYKMLIEAGASLSANEASLALKISLSNNTIDIASSIFKKFYISNIEQNWEKVIQLDSCDFIKEMLRKNADPNYLNSDNRTPLILALINKKTEISKILLDSNVLVNHVVKQQGFSIKEASTYIKGLMGDDTLSKFMENETDQELDKSYTALDIALEHKLDEIVSILRKKGGKTYKEINSL